jgi:hypothetical protein
MEARLGAALAEDLAEDDGDAVRSEEDLLAFSPDWLQWLARELGEAAAAAPGMGPGEVANWMHRLRHKLAGDARRQADAGR